MHTPLLLEMVAGAAPDRVAVGRQSDGLTFPELHRRAGRAAAWLSGHGADHVAFVGLNSPSIPSLLFASGMAGTPFVPLNYRLPDADLAKLLARIAPAVVVIDDDMLARIPPIRGITRLPRSEFEGACVDAAYDAKNGVSIEADVAVLLFTSGTTGEPKAAVLKHHNLTSYVTSSVAFLSSEETEAALVSVPPYHVAGIAAVLTAVYSGRRLVYLPAFTPEAWVATAVSERITHAMVVPTMLGRILDVLERSSERLENLRSLAYGGGRMPRPVIERAMGLLPNVDFVNGYGLTETSSTIAVLGPQDHRDAIESGEAHIRRRLSSVGRPLPSVEIQIRGPRGEVLEPGQSGEIYVKGEQVSGEYTNKKMLHDDGWFATNDGGWIDECGYLYVEGRLDDVIVRGGENISPGEIEDVLRTHPHIADIAVFGIPDNDWGECVAAVVVPKNEVPSADELTAWAKERLRSTKTPEIWEFRDTLPYNETGKLLRSKIRAEVATKRTEPV